MKVRGSVIYHGREWALGMAFALCMVFLYLIGAFTTLFTSPEKALEIKIFNIMGCVAGALLLPFILPLGALRSGSNQRFANPGFAGSRYFLRLVLLGLLFLPNIILQTLGVDAWLTSSANAGVRGFTNGIIIALVHGLFIPLAGKHRSLWAGFSMSLSLFVFYLALSIQWQYKSAFLAPALFYGSGLIMVAIGVLLFLYLSAPPGALSERVYGPSASGTPPSLPRKKRFPAFLFPLLAAAVIFWTNSFTEQLFIPVFHLPPSFHFTNVAIIVALPVLGFLADRYWQKFFRVFIVVSSCVFLLSPSLLLFTRSEIIFFILYTMNAASILLIVVVFPFAVLDLYWKESRPDTRGYWAYFLAISMHLFRVFASSQMIRFRSIPVDNAYAVVLLSLAVIVFCALSYKLVKLQADISVTTDISVNYDTHVNNDTHVIMSFAASPEESFRKHGLSKREKETAFLILQGMTNPEIAKRQYVEESTVKKHIKQILDKYKVKRRTEFMAMFLQKEE